ncbi:acyl-CoA N-acyltransferase [Coemansia spiralis]|nr:acyl-CoA N-acyltransferase [Coemansia spiralis]
MSPDIYPIHPASEAELKEAVKIRIHVFVDIQKFPLEEEVDKYDKSALHIVMLDPAQNNKVIGTLRVINTGTAAKIGRVVILPEYQGKGLGRRLLEYTEKYIANCEQFKQCAETKLGSQYDKRKFYEKCGYMARGDIYDELGCPHIWMHKTIDRISS